MKTAKPFSAALLLASSLGASNAFAAAEGVISNATLTPGSYCHLKFPAITEESLATDNPVLEPEGYGNASGVIFSAGRIVDFYGTCDTNPVGKDQIQEQRNNLTIEWDHNFSS